VVRVEGVGQDGREPREKQGFVVTNRRHVPRFVYEKVYCERGDIENRIKEGSIAARFETTVVEIRSREVVVERDGVRETIPAEGVFLLTGYLADLDFLRGAGIQVAANNVPRHDPETFETNVPGLYLAGAVVAGANRGEVFIENGRFHGRVVVEHIARRLGREAARA